MGIMLATVAGPVVIFVPGFMQRGDAWAPVAGRVGERYPSTCLDFRSHSFEGRLGELREAAGLGAAAGFRAPVRAIGRGAAPGSPLARLQAARAPPADGRPGRAPRPVGRPGAAPHPGARARR